MKSRKRAPKNNRNEKAPLDTETTIADMNVEGFRWYRPKGQDRSSVPELTGRERRAMVFGALRALLPGILGVIAVMVALFCLAYLWLH